MPREQDVIMQTLMLASVINNMPGTAVLLSTDGICNDRRDVSVLASDHCLPYAGVVASCFVKMITLEASDREPLIHQTAPARVT